MGLIDRIVVPLRDTNEKLIYCFYIARLRHPTKVRLRKGRRAMFPLQRLDPVVT